MNNDNGLISIATIIIGLALTFIILKTLDNRVKPRNRQQNYVPMEYADSIAKRLKFYEAKVVSQDSIIFNHLKKCNK